MKPFQRYLMKSIRTIMQYNLYSERQSILLASCHDQQVPYLKVPGITKYTLRFIYERSKPHPAKTSGSPFMFLALYILSPLVKTGIDQKKSEKKNVFRWDLGYQQDIQRLDTLWCFLILSLSNCKTNRLRHLSVWCFLFSHYGN